MSERHPRAKYRDLTDEEFDTFVEVDDVEFAPPGELTRTFSVRINDEELRLFSDAALAAGQPFSTFLKAAARRDIERNRGDDLASRVADEVVSRLGERREPESKAKKPRKPRRAG